MAGIGKAKKHVIDGGQAADEGVVLEYRGGLPARLAQRLCAAETADARDRDGAARGPQQPVQCRHQRRFSNAGWANDCSDRTFLEGKRYVA